METLSEADKQTVLKVVGILRGDNRIEADHLVGWARGRARQEFEAWRSTRLESGGEPATRDEWSRLVRVATLEVVEECGCLCFHAEQWRFHGSQRALEEAEQMEQDAERLADNLELLNEHVCLLKGTA